MYLLKDFLNTIFPDICLACQYALHKGEEEVCTRCRFAMPHTEHHLNQENDFWKKFSATLPIKYALSYLKYQQKGISQRLIHALKYYESQEVGKLIGRWHGSLLADHGYKDKFDYLIPVPLHPLKLAKRGYNQSDCFAEGLASALETTWSPTFLKRNKNTETQTRKERNERWANVANIFEATEPETLKNKHVAIVDDVVTTGSTLDACIRAVLACNVASVSLIAIAVAGEL